MRAVRAFVLCMALIGLSTHVTFAQVSGSSPTCGPINGKTQKDLENVRTFCEKGIPNEVVVGAYAMDSLLWVKVGRKMADEMRADRLSTEQLVLTWMKGWKQISGSKSVMVKVEWKNVEIVNGQTTLFSGDKVTIR